MGSFVHLHRERMDFLSRNRRLLLFVFVVDLNRAVREHIHSVHDGSSDGRIPEVRNVFKNVHATVIHFYFYRHRNHLLDDSHILT